MGDHNNKYPYLLRDFNNKIAQPLSLQLTVI